MAYMKAVASTNRILTQFFPDAVVIVEMLRLDLNAIHKPREIRICRSYLQPVVFGDDDHVAGLEPVAPRSRQDDPPPGIDRPYLHFWHGSPDIKICPIARTLLPNCRYLHRGPFLAGIDLTALPECRAHYRVRRIPEPLRILR